MAFVPDLPPPRRPSALPLLLAGAALALAAWLAWDRFQPQRLHVEAEPRTVEARGELADFERTSIQIFEHNAPSVVHVTSRALVRHVFGRGVQEGTGTGFVWDERGYVVTNYHVVQGLESQIVVRFGGVREYDAVVIGGEPTVDIAVIKVIDPPANLAPVRIGTSKDLQVGQAVFAIGNPFGLDHTLTTGVVSALDRVIESTQGTPIEGVIQVDAAINPGNSGGPLLDSAGLLIGMNTAIVSRVQQSAGIGFAVPVDTINRTVPRLIRGDPGMRPVLGVQLGDGLLRMPDGIPRPFVVRVEPGSGAEAAGVHGATPSTYGDVITAIDGHQVRSVDDIHAILDQKDRGQTVALRVLRQTDADRIDFEPVELQVELKGETLRRR